MTKVSPGTSVVSMMLGGSIEAVAVVEELTAEIKAELMIKVEKIVAIIKAKAIFAILLCISYSPFSS